MKKGLTELVFILDRSGSMSGLENDTIGGFNGMIKKQRDEEGEANVTTVLFDDKAQEDMDKFASIYPFKFQEDNSMNYVTDNFEVVTSYELDGKTYNVQYYNLDLILSVGYRVNSKQATKFRQWATKILKSYMTDGYAINNNRIKKNYDNFLKAIEDIKLLVTDNSSLKNNDIIELIKTFANTWLSLDKYDKDVLPTTGNIEKDTKITAKNFEKDLEIFKNELIKKNEATEFFATERVNGNLESIFCNVFQSFGGVDVYKTLEEKASNLLYFMIKNHPFVDGNKRSGAYSFIWFLKNNNILNINKINPQTLTILTILIAESNPKDKEKMIGLILQILE